MAKSKRHSRHKILHKTHRIVRRVHKKAAKKVFKENKPKMPEITKMPDERAFELLRKYKIPVAPYFFVKNENQLQDALKRIGFPCVMKVSGNSIIHKTEFNGVRTSINNAQQALDVFKQLMKIKHAEKVLIQKQLSGMEMIVGAKFDSNFGHIVTSGIGGIYVEVLRDVTFRVAPVNAGDAQLMINELKGIEILRGARTGKPINFSSLYETLAKISKLATSEKIKEMDINPLFCNEHGCFAADVRIVK